MVSPWYWKWPGPCLESNAPLAVPGFLLRLPNLRICFHFLSFVLESDDWPLAVLSLLTGTGGGEA